MSRSRLSRTRELFYHTAKRFLERFGLSLSWSEYQDLLECIKYDTDNRILEFPGKAWVQKIKFQGRSIFLICTDEGIKTAITKHQVKERCGWYGVNWKF